MLKNLVRVNQKSIWHLILTKPNCNSKGTFVLGNIVTLQKKILFLQGWKYETHTPIHKHSIKHTHTPLIIDWTTERPQNGFLPMDIIMKRKQNQLHCTVQMALRPPTAVRCGSLCSHADDICSEEQLRHLKVSITLARSPLLYLDIHDNINTHKGRPFIFNEVH